MKTLTHTFNPTLINWHRFLETLSWESSVQRNSTLKAFKEAIRLRITRPKAVFDVAEKIHRSYSSVNWGMLNWQWRCAVADNDAGDVADTDSAPTPKPP